MIRGIGTGKTEPKRTDSTDSTQPKPKKATPAFDIRATKDPEPPTPAAAASPLETMRRAFAELETQRESIDTMIDQAMGGRSFSPKELLAMQARVYVYSEEMEVISRVVDRVTSTAKTILNTQL